MQDTRQRTETEPQVAAQPSPDGKEVWIIITDITLHSTTAVNPTPFARAIQKSLTSGKPGRAYHNNAGKLVGPNGIEIPFPATDGMIEVIEKARREGKIVRFFTHKNLPIFLGKDAQEKMAALKRKGQL